MLRTSIVGALVIAASTIPSAPTVDAAAISPNNPYRSFNISGINYGSMNWERQHRGSQRSQTHRGVFFRRR